ncbi:hypothetical protein ACFQGA_15075 [Marinobacter koreensis]|uniref:hypothetical protein n=1 Tax=Marinobacter koreensis TaxID=335974 RepID=UPI003623F940
MPESKETKPDRTAERSHDGDDPAGREAAVKQSRSSIEQVPAGDQRDHYTGEHHGFFPIGGLQQARQDAGQKCGNDEVIAQADAT